MFQAFHIWHNLTKEVSYEEGVDKDNINHKLKKLSCFIQRQRFLSLRQAFDYLRFMANEPFNRRETLAMTRLISTLSENLKDTFDCLVKYNGFDHRRNIAVELLVKTLTLKERVYFMYWKDITYRKRVSEKVINFGRIIFASESSNKLLMKQTLQRWKESGKLSMLYDNLTSDRKFSNLATHASLTCNTLNKIYKNRLLHALVRLSSGLAWKRFSSNILSKLNLKFQNQLSLGFKALIYNSSNQSHATQLQKTVLFVDIFDKLFKSRTYNTFLVFKCMEVRRKKILLAFKHFDARLREVIYKWRLGRIQSIESEIRKKARFTVENKEYMNHAEALASVLNKLLNSYYNQVFRTLFAHKNRLQLVNLCFSRMGETAKNRMMLAFQTWYGESNQRLIKKFYDLIVLEKSLMNYSTSLKLRGFHRIRSTAILDYQKSYITSLWKWKLSNTEARFYTRQKVFQMRAKAVWQLYTTINLIIDKNVRSAFLRVIAQRPKASNPTSSFKFLALMMKNSAGNALRHLRFQKNEAMIHQSVRDTNKVQAANKVIHMIIINQSRKLNQVVRAWKEAINEIKRIEEKEQLLAKGYEYSKKRQVVSQFKSIMLESSRVKRKNIQLSQFLELLSKLNVKNLRCSFEKLYSIQHLYDRQGKSLVVIQNCFLRCQAHNALKLWKNKTKFEQEFNRRRIALMLRNLSKQGKIIKKEALEMWRRGNLKKNAKHFSTVLAKYLSSTMKNAFHSIMHHGSLSKQKDKIKAVNRLIRMNRVFEQLQKYNALIVWRERTKSINPWFHHSIQRITKNSRINTQVAFWRLKDSINIKGAHLSQAKIAKAKKIFYYVKKHCDLTVARAFWMIERAGRYEDFSRTFLSDEYRGRELMLAHYKRASWGAMTENTFDPHLSYSIYQAPSILVKIESSAVEKVQRTVLMMILNKQHQSRFDPNKKKEQAFRLWRLASDAKGSKLIASLGVTVSPRKLKMLTKHGAVDFLRIKLLKVFSKHKKAAFDLLMRPDNRVNLKLIHKKIKIILETIRS